MKFLSHHYRNNKLVIHYRWTVMNGVEEGRNISITDGILGNREGDGQSKKPLDTLLATFEKGADDGKKSSAETKLEQAIQARITALENDFNVYRGAKQGRKPGEPEQFNHYLKPKFDKLKEKFETAKQKYETKKAEIEAGKAAAKAVVVDIKLSKGPDMAPPKNSIGAENLSVQMKPLYDEFKNNFDAIILRDFPEFRYEVLVKSKRCSVKLFTRASSADASPIQFEDIQYEEGQFRVSLSGKSHLIAEPALVLKTVVESLKRKAGKGANGNLEKEIEEAGNQGMAVVQKPKSNDDASKAGKAAVASLDGGSSEDAAKKNAEIDKKNAKIRIYNEADAECSVSTDKYQAAAKELAPIVAAYSKSKVEIEKDSQNTLYNSFKEISENAATKMKSLSADEKYKGVADIQKINDRYEQQKMNSIHSMGLLMLVTGEYQKARDHMLSCKTYFDSHADAKATVNFDKIFDLINSKLEAKIKADKQKTDEDAAKQAEQETLDKKNTEIGAKKYRVAKKLSDLSDELYRMIKSAPNFNDASAKNDYEQLVRNRASQLKDMSDSIRSAMDRRDIVVSTFDTKPLVGMTADELFSDKKSTTDLSKQIAAPFEKQVREAIEKRKTDATAEAVKKAEAEKLQGNADKYIADILEAVAAKFKEMDADANKRPDFLKDEKTYAAFKTARGDLLSRDNSLVQDQGVMQRMFNDLKSAPGEEKNKAEIVAYMSNPTIIANEKADKVVSAVVTKFKTSLTSKPAPGEDKQEDYSKFSDDKLIEEGAKAFDLGTPEGFKKAALLAEIADKRRAEAAKKAPLKVAPAAGVEKNNNIPELTLTLKDIPQDSPENFNKTIIENIKSAQKGLVDYLNTYRATALKNHPMAGQKMAPGYEEGLSTRVDAFIADITKDAATMIDAVNKNSSKPIDEQKKILGQADCPFARTMAKNMGIMQSFIPFKLESAYAAIDQKIMKPLGIVFLASAPAAPAVKAATKPAAEPVKPAAAEKAPEKLTKSQLLNVTKTLEYVNKIEKKNGNITLKGFLAWVADSDEKGALDATTPEGKARIFACVKKFQDGNMSGLAKNLQGRFGPKTYEKLSDPEKRLMKEPDAVKAEKTAADAAKTATEKLEAYKKDNPESPEAVGEKELTGDLRESALAIGNRGAPTEYQVRDVVVYKVASGGIDGANNYRKNGDNYSSVKKMLSKLDGAIGDLGKFTVTDADVTLMKPLVEMRKAEDAVLALSKEAAPKFADIIASIDALRKNPSYSKASKYEYVDDNLLSTLRLACEHGKDGKIPSPISAPLQDYMFRLLRDDPDFSKMYPGMHPHIQAIVQDIIAAKAKSAEPAKPKPAPAAPEVASSLVNMSGKEWKDAEKTYVNESYEKKNTFYQILNALAVSKKTGKPAELMSSALFSPVILDMQNGDKTFDAIKVTYKGVDDATQSDKVEFSYGKQTFTDLKSFVDYIAANADITSFSKSNNEALKAQAARMAPQKEAIKDISDTMEGKLNTLFAKYGKGSDVRGTAISELKIAFDRSKANHGAYEVNSNHSLSGNNIFATKDGSRVMLEYKGENGNDTKLFLRSIDPKTKAKTDTPVEGGIDGFIAKLKEIAAANGKLDVEKAAPAPAPVAIPPGGPGQDTPPEDLDEERELDTTTDPEYKRLDGEAGKLYDVLLKSKKAGPINDSPQRQPIWRAYMEAEKKIMEYVKETSGTPYYRSMLHVAHAKMGLGDLEGAKNDLRQVASFFNTALQKDPSVAKFADKAAELIVKINEYQKKHPVKKQK